MKKFLITIILAVSIVTPLFAAKKGNIELVGKLGVALNPTDSFEASDDDAFFGYTKNQALSISAEALCYLLPELPLGFGINYQFNSGRVKQSENITPETGVTNIYLTVKPTLKTDLKIFTSVYAIGQIGYGFNRMDNYYDDEYIRKIDGDGLCWGLGIGTEIINNFIFEFIFSTNYWSVKYEHPNNHLEDYKTDAESTAFSLFLGYKFNI